MSSLRTASTTRKADLAVNLGSLLLTNPVMPASGCFGFELAPLIPLNRLGAVVTKTLFARLRSGNPAHRLTETPHGMLNAVGIPSRGTKAFLAEILPGYIASGAPVVISIGGLAVSEYWTVTDELAGSPYDALEVNVSCPNLEHGGLEIGADPMAVYEVTRGVCDLTDKPVIVKLTPNVARIHDIAQAAEEAGATAITVCNTFVGLAVDLQERRPVLGNTTGGVSGQAIKPIALRLVWQAAQAVTIPVIGCGGIATTRDAAEFIMAGATAVQVGTATFTQPDTMIRIIDELPAVLDSLGVETVRDLVGTLDVAGAPRTYAGSRSNRHDSSAHFTSEETLPVDRRPSSTYHTGGHHG